MSLEPGGALGKPGRAKWIRILKLFVGLLVIAAVMRHVAATWTELRARGDSLRVDPPWLMGAVGLYLLGLIIDGLWFHRVMRASATPISLPTALRAYLISHLGKYVPGKAMVVVVRASIASSAGARPASAVFASLYETLVMMASGATIATLGYALTPARNVPIKVGPLGTHNVPLITLNATFASAFLLLALPPVFPRLSAAASATLRGRGANAVPPLSFSLLAEGLALSGLGWLFLGASQYAVLRALGIESVGLEAMPVLVASVALATVAGFVMAVAPGGLGVREWVLWTSLGVLLDHEQAVIAALVLRFCWLVGELLAASICWLAPLWGRLRPSRVRSSTAPPSIDHHDPVGPGIFP